MYVVALFGVDNGDDDLAEKPQRDEPSFPIREPVVIVRVGHALEHLLRIGEVESVLLEVPSSLRLIPRDHLWSVYTSCIRVKGWRSEGLTRVTVEDPRRLNDRVERILAKGASSREALLADVRALVAASVGRGRSKEPT